MKKIIGVVLVLVLTASCGLDVKEEGVVAKVNGKPIYMRQLEDRYDLLHLGWAGGQTPSVGKLKGEYSQILFELIIQELVDQALEKKGLSVTDEEVDRAEARVRADYPKGSFEKLMVEEYIDLDVWRVQLRAKLAQEKFLEKVLRPGVKIGYKEAEEYYKSNISDFYVPAKLRFLMVAGPGRKMVRNAVELYLDKKDLSAVSAAFPQVSVQEMNMRLNRLPAAWSDALSRLEPNEASQVAASQNGFESLILLERIPEQLLDASNAYPKVEQILVDKKMRQVFSDWLDNELNQSEIVITRLLLPDGNETESVIEAVNATGQ